MKKISLLIIISLFLITGCNNQEENEKSEYLAMKSKLLETSSYTKQENIPCDITVNIDRVDDEKVSYNVILSNPKEDMRKIKAIVVHNYYNEDIFPTIGLFNKTTNLFTSDKEKQLKLKGTIDTTTDIDSLNLELKVFIKYTNQDGKEKDIYYKTT